MNPFLSTILITFLLSPVSALASLDSFFEELEGFEEEMQLIDTEDEELDLDVYIEGEGELFPFIESDEEEVVTESPFVSIQTEDQGEVELIDVPKDAWFGSFVRDLGEKGVFSGYRDLSGRLTGEFGPADHVTIEQLAKIAVVAAGIDPASCVSAFKNTAAVGRWSEKYVRCAEHHRFAIFNELPLDLSRPATRVEVVVTVLQAFRAEIGDPGASPFTDVTSATEFSNYIIRAALDSVVSGYKTADGTPLRLFGPTDPVTRAGVAKIVSLAMQTY